MRRKAEESEEAYGLRQCPRCGRLHDLKTKHCQHCARYWQRRHERIMTVYRSWEGEQRDGLDPDQGIQLVFNPTRWERGDKKHE